MSLTLGIDLGTSKVAAAIVDTEDRRTLDAVAILHRAAVPTAEGYSEQDLRLLGEALNRAVLGLHEDYRQDVAALGITGQMHGVVLWNPETGSVSNLIDWQDQRCLDRDFLPELRRRTGDPDVHSGFGWATLEWFQQTNPDHLADYNCAGTLADYIGARLVGARQASMDPTNADSWGLFNAAAREWRPAALEELQLSARFIPNIRPSASHLGNLLPEYAEAWQLSTGIPVGVPCGDNPASIYATLAEPERQIALTLGTGGQLAVVISPDAPRPDAFPGLSYRPYVDERSLAVATSLCGGSAFTWLAQTVERWFSELQVKPPPQVEILNHLIELGLRADGGGLRVDTSFAGERHRETKRGRIDGVDLTNLSLGNLSRAVCRGIVDGLLDSMPPEFLAGREQVVGSGNAVRRSALMREVIEARLGLPLQSSAILEEAASGVALLVAQRLLKQS